MAVGPPAVEVEADQPGDVVGARVPGNVAGGALLDDPAVLDHDQPVGQHHRVQRVVRDQHGDGLELREMAAQPGPYLQPGTGVQRGERLVEQQQSGPGRQGAGEGDALRLTPGETPGPGVGVVGQAHPVQPRGRLFPGLHLGGAAAARAERHVVQRAEVREEQVVLEDHADRAGLGGRTVQCGAVQAQVPAGEGLQAGQGAQGRGLAGTVGAEQGHHLTGGRGQGDVQPEAAAVDHQTGVETGLVGAAGVRAGTVGAARVRAGAVGGHEAVIQRSRSPARTAMETASSTRLRAIAAAGSFCRAR
ncbi:hypothetical protein SFUMM280S_09567 [Streptomyces fumanus]